MAPLLFADSDSVECPNLAGRFCSAALHIFPMGKVVSNRKTIPLHCQYSVIHRRGTKAIAAYHFLKSLVLRIK